MAVFCILNPEGFSCCVRRFLCFFYSKLCIPCIRYDTVPEWEIVKRLPLLMRMRMRKRIETNGLTNNDHSETNRNADDNRSEYAMRFNWKAQLTQLASTVCVCVCVCLSTVDQYGKGEKKWALHQRNHSNCIQHKRERTNELHYNGNEPYLFSSKRISKPGLVWFGFSSDGIRVE